MADRIVVLASGGGTNAQALIDACAAGVLDAEVVAVISNNASAGVLQRATSAGIATCLVDHRGSDPQVRQAADDRLIEAIRGYLPDLVVLAGWMRVLGASVGAAFPVINLHPAKPGAFAGLHAVERAYEAWKNGEIEESGVMVHWVPDEGVDVGPTIEVATVPFVDGEQLAGFERRLHATEHQIIVSATATALKSLKGA